MIAVSGASHRSLHRPGRGHLTLVSLPAGTADRGARALALTYWRRRAVALLLVVALAAAVGAGLGALGGALTASEPPGSAPTALSAAGGPAAVVEVGPGDTLWTIARRLQPEGDLRPLVYRLAAAHGGATIRPGERIPVPRPG